MKNNKALLAYLCIILCCCTQIKKNTITKGVSLELARERVRNITKINYKLKFDIPESSFLNIESELVLSFNLKDTSSDLQLDFNENSVNILSIKKANKEIDIKLIKEHIIIDKEHLAIGKNIFEIQFIAGNSSLNRNSDLMYTLLVPDKARSLFPCFDQTDLKANFELTLKVPKNWTAISNSKIAKKQNRTYIFEKTTKLPTYLFSFVAGRFESISKTYKDKKYTLYHRETNQKKLDYNVDSIFHLLFNSIDYLENYTDIKYPFTKYDMIAIPDFQYKSMEHPGAVLYNTSSLFLDSNASQTEIIARATNIAHESAHMWFGNFVSIKWFNQVWLKELLANFFASKITGPLYEKANHNLVFFNTHFEKAYIIDRSKGSKPINQELVNLENAKTLYGKIIYNKSAIIMQKLESIIGEDKLREGLREYLKKFSFSNATWEDLIKILDGKTDKNLYLWNNQWVNTANMPTIGYNILYDNNKIKLHIHQNDKLRKGRLWNQRLEIILQYKNDTHQVITTCLNRKNICIEDITSSQKPLYILLNSKGIEYGLFEIDSSSMQYFTKNLHSIKNSLHRAIIWSNIWENLYSRNISNAIYMSCLKNNLKQEKEAIIVEKLLKNINIFYWQYLNSEERKTETANLENIIWSALEETSNASLKKSYLKCLSNISQTDKSLNILLQVWEKKIHIDNLKLSTQDYTMLAYELCIKIPSKKEYILNIQENRIITPLEIKQFQYIKPSLSRDIFERDNFFESLKEKNNRKHKNWTLTALRFFNHPINKELSIKYLKSSLDMLVEIEKTGDIFFPNQWLKACYWGHTSKEAKAISDIFLSTKKKYPNNLRLKILQASQYNYR